MSTDCVSGTDAFSPYIFQDAFHLLFIQFGAFLIAISLVFSPKWALNIWFIYMLNLVLGLFGMIGDASLQLCWGWYIHTIVMFGLGWLMNYLTEDLFWE